jgi:SAM-dependent methyltransferase
MQVPGPVKRVLRPIWRGSHNLLNRLLDLYDLLRGKKNPLVPPRHMMFVGDGDYEKTGNEFLEYFKDLGKLKPSDRILDVGCGIGRISVPLTKYLSDEGAYNGFDIVKMGIDWCNKNIASKYRNFHFHHSNIYNKMYNPEGKERSSEYRFIYESNFFDFVFLTSVFTHMFSSDVNHYVTEISRVMKEGARCLISCFLLNQEADALIGEGRSTQRLIYPLDENSFTKDKDTPESAIGYREEYFTRICTDHGLQLDGEIHYGSWCGREQFMSYQDIVIVRKF